MATRAQIRAELENNISIVVGRIGVNLITGLRDATPRDTSYHASRWVGAVGGPPVSRTTPNTRSGRLAAVSFGQQSASIAAVRAYRLSRGRLFVSNDGNYIEQLAPRIGIPGVINGAIRGVSTVGTTLR